MPSCTANPNVPSSRVFFVALAIGFVLVACFETYAQRFSILTPDPNDIRSEFSERLQDSLSKSFRAVDGAMATAAFRSFGFEQPFNLTTDDAKTAGAAIGCDFMIFVGGRNQRRYSTEKKEYFEAFAPIFVVSSRTGRLILFKLQSKTAVSSDAAEKLLLDSVGDVAKSVSDAVSGTYRNELTEEKPVVRELPADGSAEAKLFRPPVPYKRIAPPYTTEAGFYRIAATIDIEVDFDTDGRVTRTEILRWAGFGLDESVDRTVRQMNWRPAMQAGKPTPVRVLLRYNFKKIEKDDSDK